MLAHTFVRRPIFAIVLAIIVSLIGIGGIVSLSIAQYPEISPVHINVRGNYPGASADVLTSSVTQVIEQQLTGIDNLLYFQSTSSGNGQVQITATFDKGTNPDIAQVQVQNKVQQALPRLPAQVQAQGLTVTKSAPDFLAVVSIYDETDRATSIDIGDYIVSNLQEPMSRINGVGDVTVFGAQYAMRIWLDPFKLARVGLQPGDVNAAIAAQNTQVAAGQIGSLPSPPGQMLNVTVNARSRLQTPEQFRQIILKTQENGAVVRLQDVARVELGSENYTTISRLNGHPAAGMGILLAPGADALATNERVRTFIEQQTSTLPAGYKIAFPVDSTQFIKLSIKEVLITLAEAIVLVVIVMFVFLQSWRATLIPTVAVPVVLLGTFGVLAAAGFSINVLTMFGLVLSIGLLVDDAIVVVENVERVMHEDPDISVNDAVLKAMGEINVALVAIALVLSAVFLPMAFFGGSVGVIYQQFSITIVSSMALSVLVALTLSPALAAMLLKRRQADAPPPSGVGRWARRGGEWFERNFARLSRSYVAGVEWAIARRGLMLIGFAGLVAALAWQFTRLPTGFLPTEDQGRTQLLYTLPPGATFERTLAVAEQIEHYFKSEPLKRDAPIVYTIIGQSIQGAGQNTGRGFVSLSPWDDRQGTEHSQQAISARATKELGARLRDAQFFALDPPAVRGLGQATGFTMELLNTGNLSYSEFKRRLETLIARAAADPKLSSVRANRLPDVPTMQVTFDDQKLGALGLSPGDVNTTLSTAWGGAYVNDFVDRGRVKRVYVQGDAPYRAKPEDLANWFVRGSGGALVPFAAFAQSEWAQAPVQLTRFNGQPSFEIEGQGAAGVSSGDAMRRIADLAKDLPGTAIAWSGLSYQEQVTGNQAPLLYGVSLLVVFLCLAALYESWSIPIAVMLVIPVGLLGATLAVGARGLDNDVYFQVGLLTTIGLSAKNAILIVEFAEQAERSGKSAYDAAIEAARLRLRPILMTSFAFIFGVLPLAISTGAGAQSRIAIGTAVLGGMLTATALAIFFVPMFYVLVRKLFRSRLHGHAGYTGIDPGEPQVAAGLRGPERPRLAEAAE
ncbi:MAG: multidrug efflux RND transporter permease subunit [Sphingomonadaceae bacterium]|nr:multidrug efflux RND transporter permease subunit [Sphingomonadaceae bacterium]